MTAYNAAVCIVKDESSFNLLVGPETEGIAAGTERRSISVGAKGEPRGKPGGLPTSADADI